MFKVIFKLYLKWDGEYFNMIDVSDETDTGLSQGTETLAEEEGLGCTPGYMLPSLCIHITAWKQEVSQAENQHMRREPVFWERFLRNPFTTRPSLSRVSNKLNPLYT